MMSFVDTTTGHSSAADQPAAVPDAYRNPFDKKVVWNFFQDYERRADHDLIEEIRYYQLKFCHTKQQWIYLNKLAELFARQGKPSLAFMCLTESLRQNHQQSQVLAQAESLKSQARPQYPPADLAQTPGLVSVIMPTLNRGQLIQPSLESVLEQVGVDFELLVINDGGNDEASQVIKRLGSPKIRYLKLEKNRGVSAATNQGILHSRGQFIAYLDDDDLYYPDHLKSLHRALSAPGTAQRLVYAKTKKVRGRISGGAFEALSFDHFLGQPFDRNVLIYKTFIATCSVMHEKSLFREVGLFNEDLNMSQDWDLWLRCLQSTDFKFLERVVAEYRWKDDNSTVNRAVEAAFLGSLMPRFHIGFQGQLAFAKCYQSRGNKKEFAKNYTQIRFSYPRMPKALYIIKELLPMARSLQDPEFFDQLSADYFAFDARGFLQEAWEKRSWPMLGAALKCFPRRYRRRNRSTIPGSSTQRLTR